MRLGFAQSRSVCKKILVYRNPKNETSRAKTCQNDKKKWPKLDLEPRTAERPDGRTASAEKTTAKIDDFRSVLRGKNDFL